mmetsp:Transcript_20077/g.34526  ORF Transcript_20077/g.34526 Transcript_20077/m.34526 type:complete len:320 (-) Transcript_20077:1618-2577(-)
MGMICGCVPRFWSSLDDDVFIPITAQDRVPPDYNGMETAASNQGHFKCVKKALRIVWHREIEVEKSGHVTQSHVLDLLHLHHGPEIRQEGVKGPHIQAPFFWDGKPIHVPTLRDLDQLGQHAACGGNQDHIGGCEPFDRIVQREIHGLAQQVCPHSLRDDNIHGGWQLSTNMDISRALAVDGDTVLQSIGFDDSLGFFSHVRIHLASVNMFGPCSCRHHRQQTAACSDIKHNRSRFYSRDQRPLVGVVALEIRHHVKVPDCTTKRIEAVQCSLMCLCRGLFFTSNPNVVKHDPLLRVILSPSRDHNVHLNGFTGCHILV